MTNNTMKTSLIISTYNQPQFLRLALLSALEQTRLPDEIIIADDGSRQETADVVAEIKKNVPPQVKLMHVWQEDDGYRLTCSLNNAAAASSGEYLIIIDGDCFVEQHFIEDHIFFAEKNHFVCGTRVNIRPKRKEYILRTGNRKITFFSWGTSKKPHAIRSHFLAGFRKKGGMAGANFAVWRSDYEKVNGFNERLINFSGCDYELFSRLQSSGVIAKKMAHLGIAYHFDHPLTKRVRWNDGTGQVSDLMRKIREEETEHCENGLNRALEGRYKIIE
jgi:glycosyltransferase involved in cell wall biosynthesis